MALVCLAASLPAGALGQSIPRDERAFTEHVAARMRSQIKNVPIEVRSPLTIVVGELQANLDRVHSFCRANSRDCAAEIDRYVDGVAQVLRDRTAAPTREAIRIVVRSADYVRGAEEATRGGKGSLQPRPLVEGLVLLPVLDFPRSIRMLTERDNEALGISLDEAFRIGLSNLERDLGPVLKVATPAGRGQIGQLSGNPYDTSRVAQAAQWTPLAEAQGGTLIVAVPATDIVLYISESTPAAIGALRTAVKHVASRAPNPLSTVLLRWSPQGWQLVPER